MKKRANATMHDVARLAGVALMTVSRVVNGNSYVSAETEKKVRAAIKKLKFRPNEAAQILKGQRAKTIGLIVPDLADPFFAMVANSVQQVAAAQGYMTLVVTSERNEEFEADEIHMMARRNIAGLLLVPTRTSFSALESLAENGVPIVALDRSLPGIVADEVTVENFGGAQIAVDHLISHGHKRIACLGYDHEVQPIQERMRGYSTAMQIAHLTPEIHGGIDSVEAIEAILQAWSRSADKPTALFTLNNVTTIHTLVALQNLHIRVPEEMALVGFDDFELGPLLKSPLTAVRQPPSEIGRRAARLLFDHIDTRHETAKTAIKLVLPVELIIRQSCGCKADDAANRRNAKKPRAK